MTKYKIRLIKQVDSFDDRLQILNTDTWEMVLDLIDVSELMFVPTRDGLGLKTVAEEYIRKLQQKIKESRTNNNKEDRTTTCPNMQEFEKLEYKFEEVKKERNRFKKRYRKNRLQRKKYQEALEKIKTLVKPRIVHGLTDIEYVRLYTNLAVQILTIINEVLKKDD